LKIITKMPTPSSGEAQVGKDLWKAASNNEVGRVKEILKMSHLSRRVINWEDEKFKRTPFYRSCYFGFTEIAKCFMNDPRTELNQQQSQGCTPFFIACQQGQGAIVKMVLEDEEYGKFEVNTPNFRGETPFFIACQNQRVDIVRMLLDDVRTEVNQAENENVTPLWIAAQENHLDVIEWILASPLEIDVSVKSGGEWWWSQLTASEQARESGNHECGELIEAYGKDKEAVRRVLRHKLKIHRT
jgi:ankyrin repeat protein